jgi:hypothetical protein
MDDGSVSMLILNRHGEPEAIVCGVQVTVPENVGLLLAEHIAVSIRRKEMNLTKTRNGFRRPLSSIVQAALEDTRFPASPDGATGATG